MKKNFLIVVVIIAVLSCIGCRKEDVKELSDYPPMVYWNDQYYMIQDGTLNVGQDDLEVIGEILQILDPGDKLTEHASSNEFEVGATLYTLNGHDENDKIVILYGSKYYEANAK